MSIRMRKFFGAIALLLLVSLWALLAMAFAQYPVIFDNPLLSVVYYVLAGVGWILPAMPLIAWMSRPDPG
jgi:hypothetical protein